MPTLNNVPQSTAQLTDVVLANRGGVAGGALGTDYMLPVSSILSFVPTSYPAMNTTAINQAMVTASLAGGGLVQLQPGSYAMTGPLIAQNNVALVGARGYLTSNGGITGGTVLTGNGAFDGLDYFGVPGGSATQSTLGDLGSQSLNSTQFNNAKLSGFSIANLTFSGFYNGIKIGALYNPGGNGLNIQNVSCIQGTGWGFWIENYWLSYFANLVSSFNVGGAFWFCSSAAGAIDGGNSKVELLTVQTGNNSVSTRGIVFSARGNPANSLNQTPLDNCTVSFSNRTAVSQTATMTNGSQNVTVTNGALFIPDQPVTMSGTLTNTPFAPLITYFVLSVSGNVLTITDYPGHVSLAAATGSASFTINSYGFSPLEIIGYYNGSANHNLVFPMSFTNLDLEVNAGVANSMVTLASVRGINLGFNYVDSGSIATVVQRISDAVTIYGNDTIGTPGTTFDIDNTYANPTIVLPRYQIGQTANFTGSVGIGWSSLSHNATDTRALSGGALGYLSGNTGPEIKFNKNSSAVEFANFPIAIPTTQLSTGTSIPPATAGQTSAITCIGSSTGTLALPTIAANGDGEIYCISNPNAGAWTITASQNIIGAGASTTSFSIPAETENWFRGCNNAGTLYYSVK